MEWLERLRRWLAERPDSALADPLPASPEMCRAATWSDVEALAALLHKHGVEYILVGGYALHANGLVRQTGDIDILVRNSQQNNTRWIKALSELPDGVASILADEIDPFPKEDDSSGEDEDPGVIRIADEILVDVMPKACGRSYEDLLPYAAQLDTEHGFISVLNLYGLWLTKQGVRDKDKSDRRQIEMALDKLREWPSDQDMTKFGEIPPPKSHKD